MANPSTSNGVSSTVTSTVIGAPLAIITSTFANLPNPIPIKDQIWRVTDVGTNGSLWVSDGTQWTPLNGTTVLFQGGLPFIFPSSGTVTAGGGLTLNTALDQTYASGYAYFPAGMFTGSTAGFYYVQMTSTTVGTVFNNPYTSGMPAIPAVLVPITTGAGAYTQTTGSTVAGQTITIPGNVIGANGHIYMEMQGPCANSATGKSFATIWGGTSLGTVFTFASTAVSYQNFLANNGVTGKQNFTNKNYISGGANIGNSAKDTTQPVTISVGYNLGVAADWFVCEWCLIHLRR